MSNNSLKEDINKYLNKQKHRLEPIDKKTLKNGFNLMRKKIRKLRDHFRLNSLRGINVYLLDSENIGRTKSHVWSAERVIQAYNDFKSDKFRIYTNESVRIPIIFLYKTNRVNQFLKAWNPRNNKKKNKEIWRFIIPLDGKFASHLKTTIEHYSPDDMQIIHYGALLKIYKDHFKIGEDCKNCIKGVRIVSKDQFRDHDVDSSIKLAPHTVKKKRGMPWRTIIPRSSHKADRRRPQINHKQWHQDNYGRAPPSHVMRLSPSKKARNRRYNSAGMEGPSGLTPVKKRSTRGKSRRRSSSPSQQTKKRGYNSAGMEGPSGLTPVKKRSTRGKSRRRSSSSSQLQHTWEEVIDKRTGDIYYWNTNTGDTQWERPKFLNRRQRQTLMYEGGGTRLSPTNQTKKRGSRKRGGKSPKRTIKKRKSGRKHRRTKRRRRR